ncbi:c-type cytochrome [Neisseria sp. Ec49-e6-T10]|uniref:c-type cytochrome n=1 Tax=Neisseria sp. Ec49-e6-T10 TaxID=3140744 RepID=UPI003EBD8FD1
MAYLDQIKTFLKSGIIILAVLSPQLSMAADQQLIDKGTYLARAADCMACHTAKGAENTPFAGGYEFPMPMGIIVSSNITPSKQFGIGQYTEEQFKKAIKEGIRADGSRLYPAMPYTEYSQITDEDIHALYAYFMNAVEPVDEAPQAKSKLSFPFNAPGMMAVWDGLFLNKASFKNDPTVSNEINRGRYLVDALAHCGTCHTPRNSFMASDQKQYLSGSVVNGWFAPNITSDPISGIGGWTNEELVTYFKNGHVPNKGQAAGGMAEAVEKSLKHLTDEDLNAIALYLKTVTPIHDKNQTLASYAITQAKPLEVSLIETGNNNNQKGNINELDGAVLYNAACASCHGMNGEGTRDGQFPSLTQNSSVGAMQPNNLVMAIAFGVQRAGQDQTVLMPAFGVASNSIGSKLTDAQIAAVANYVIDRFGQSKVVLTERQVATIKKGGETPFLIKAAPALAVIFGLMVFALLIWCIQKFRSRRR